MNKFLGILAGAGLLLGLSFNPIVYAADSNLPIEHDSVANGDVNHSSSHENSEIGEVDKDHALTAEIENEREDKDAMHTDHELMTAESHESQTAETHDSGVKEDRQAGIN